MARLSDGTTAEYLQTAAAVVTAHPLTIACWFKATVADEVDDLVTITPTSGTGDAFRLRLGGLTAGDPIQAVSRESGEAVAETTTGFTTGVWHHAAGTWVSTTERNAFIDGGSKGTNTDSKNPTGLSRTNIFAFRTDSTFNPMAGSIAEVGIWDVELTDDEIRSLAGGVTPNRIRSLSSVGYWPLWGTGSPEPDLSGGGNPMTVTGTVVQADHAPVAAPFGLGMEWQGNFTVAVAAAFIPRVMVY